MSTRTSDATGSDGAAAGAAWPIAIRNASSATSDTTKLPAAPALPCSATDCDTTSLPPLRT
eukprot:1231918-Prymnesium_polylepis.1